MALTCVHCGHYRREAVLDGHRRCVHCGHDAGVARHPLLVVTGAAASGKSTVCASLAGSPGLLALDGDVLAAGAAAVTAGRHDYPAFWRHFLDLAREVGDIDKTLREPTVPPPHTLTRLDRSTRPPQATIAAARAWATDILRPTATRGGETSGRTGGLSRGGRR